METLPPEMVQKVSQNLTARDLARCCAVSPKWREIFDQDWLWKPHCDPELEEPLRTTPSVVKPVFVSPEGKNSTLTTISKWRLAFLRERHLWGNWMTKNWETHSFGSDTILLGLFLSNNLFVSWTERNIQILDVSVVPPSLVGEIDSPVGKIDYLVSCYLSRLNSNTLLLDNRNGIQVFLVDIINNSIKLKHEFPLKRFSFDSYCHTKPLTSVDGSVILGISASDFYLEILDLEKGMKILEVPCPDRGNNANIYRIETSPTNDDVLVFVYRGKAVLTYNPFLDVYIYSLQQKLFLPGPIASTNSTYTIAINKHYVALGQLPSMRILDYHTSEVVFKNEDQEDDIFPQAYKDIFIYLEKKSGHCWLKLFSLSNKTISTVLEVSPPTEIRFCLEVVNNKFVAVYSRINSIKSDNSEDSWGKYLNLIIFERPNKLIISASTFLKVKHSNMNKACTRGFSRIVEEPTLYYYW